MKIEQKRLFGIRGAVFAENTREDIGKKVKDLYVQILAQNDLLEEQIVSIQFSITPDLTAVNPASALRQAGCALSCALFCCAEPAVDNGIPFVIRVLVTAYLDKNPVSVYIHGAQNLRTDLLRS
jgi:chorismate mutase